MKSNTAPKPSTTDPHPTTTQEIKQDFQEYLYRATDSSPERKFAEGFKAKGKNYNLAEHVFDNPFDSGYIST